MTIFTSYLEKKKEVPRTIQLGNRIYSIEKAYSKRGKLTIKYDLIHDYGG